MSETLKNINAATRRDAELAQRVAYAEEPFRVGADHARNLGEMAAFATLDAMQARAGEEAYQGYAVASHEGEELPQEPADESHVAQPETADTDKEKIREWLNEGAASLNTWMAGQTKIDSGHQDSGGSTGFNTFYNKRDRFIGVKFRGEKLPDTARDSFAEEDIAELVTIQPEEYVFGTVNDASEYAGEEAVSIIYRTLSTGYKTKFKARVAGDGARGNTVTMHMILPKSKADEMVRMIKEDPELLHKLADSLMLEDVQAGQDWKDTRPPYEEWRAINDDVSKIAFRDSVIAPLKDSEVIEY